MGQISNFGSYHIHVIWLLFSPLYSNYPVMDGDVLQYLCQEGLGSGDYTHCLLVWQPRRRRAQLLRCTVRSLLKLDLMMAAVDLMPGPVLWRLSWVGCRGCPSRESPTRIEG